MINIQTVKLTNTQPSIDGFDEKVAKYCIGKLFYVTDSFFTDQTKETSTKPLATSKNRIFLEQ